MIPVGSVSLASSLAWLASNRQGVFKWAGTSLEAVYEDIAKANPNLLGEFGELKFERRD